MRLTKAGRKILGVIFKIDLKQPDIFVADTQIAEQLNIHVREVQDNLDMMHNLGLVILQKTFGPTFTARITAMGRIAVREPAAFEEYPVSQNINVLQVIDSKIQNIAQSGAQAVITQSVTSTDLDEIFGVIDKMVSIVKSEKLTEEEKSDYELEATELKTELRKSKPSLNRIREMLSFLGDVEGVLGLTARISPLLIQLGLIIERLTTS